ncbi:hypothetical protein [Halovulum sp. GXIMD14793]
MSALEQNAETGGPDLDVAKQGADTDLAELLARSRLLTRFLFGVLFGGLVFVGTLFLAHRAVLQDSWLSAQHEGLLLAQLLVLALAVSLVLMMAALPANRSKLAVRHLAAFLTGALITASLVFAVALTSGLVFDDWFTEPEGPAWWEIWADSEPAPPEPKTGDETAAWWEIWK